MERITIDQQTASRLPSGETSQPSNSRRALILRCQLALFSAYRIDQYGDPEGFKTSVGAVLEQYPNEVMIYVCDPRTGIQRRCKFPPTLSEIIEACDTHQEFLARAAKPRTALPPRQSDSRWNERPQGALGNIFVPEGHPRYSSLVERTKTLEPVWWKFGKASDGRAGLYIPLNVWDGSGITGTF